MRPPRIAILALCVAASLFLFCRSVASLRHARLQDARLRSFFSLTAPFTLFPPNAAISLTDDNSTFFPARPAAFGPYLPARGLSGQLWIGSGFADDALDDRDGEGELGCSDVPGWEPGRSGGQKTKPGDAEEIAGSPRDLGKDPPFKRSVGDTSDRGTSAERTDDGTDDYLHQGLQTSSSSPRKSPADTDPLATSHADIQSLQEAAEITGKVVLLSRGGCGFLEKVKWAQRRGAIAVVVGDNQKGGPLIQMYARGDTSNVTIPAIFTSRTTAHLLSSLMRPGSFLEDFIDENGKPVSKVQQMDRPGRKWKPATPTYTTLGTKATPVTSQRHDVNNNINGNNNKNKNSKNTPPGDKSVSGGSGSSSAADANWVLRLFHLGGRADDVSNRSRPPSSGRLDWVLIDDWSDEKDEDIMHSLERAISPDSSSRDSSRSSSGSSSRSSSRTSSSRTSSSRANNQVAEDSFQIGVQDWRDPDLVQSPADPSDPSDPADANDKASAQTQEEGIQPKSQDDKDQPPSSKSSKSNKDKPSSGKSSKSNGSGSNGPKGGSITPGSGEYAPEVVGAGLIAKIFGDDDEADFAPIIPDPNPIPITPGLPRLPPADGVHEGLWVTITPQGMASSFFDTLLVLVVSPLITLTVVYALLILRARLRRRRWRAPKSVVEQLPVRTYHSVVHSGGQSPRQPSSPSGSSPTTPLLQGSSRPRPRSRTTTGVPEAEDLLRVDSATPSALPPPQPPRPASRAVAEKKNTNNAPHASQWKKYMSRQVECVVCLEEYVDGVSRVMSLPCGHEFHAECITPWLTTRRRTCPICKGDVVRSLARGRGSPSSPRYDPYRDEDDEDGDVDVDDIEAEAASAADRPISPPATSSEAEQGRRSGRPATWLSLLLTSSLGTIASSSSSSSRAEQPSMPDDRSR